MKKIIQYVAGGLSLAVTKASALAQTPGASPSDWHAQTLGQAIINSIVFGALGIALVLIGFKIFDRAITRVDLEKEIASGNVAAAILSGAAIIAFSIIIAAAIS